MYTDLFDFDDFLFISNHHIANDVINCIDSLFSLFDMYEEPLYSKRSFNELKKQYQDSYDLKFNSRHISAFKELCLKLEQVTSKDLNELHPEMYFKNRWDDTPDTPIYNLKDSIQELLDLLNWFDEVKDNTKDEDTGKTTPVKVFQDIPILYTTIESLEKAIHNLDAILNNMSKFIFSTKLKYLAKKKKLTQTSISKTLLIRQQTVSEWFCGKSLPSIDKAIQLAILLETSVDFLVRPDIQESNLANDYIFKEIGLSSASSEKLKKAMESQKYYSPDTLQTTAQTLNLLIDNLYKANDMDLLSALTAFLRPQVDQTLYVVSDADFNNLAMNISESTDKANDTLRDFIHRFHVDSVHTRGTIHDVSNTQLITISKILTRIKDSLRDREF